MIESCFKCHRIIETEVNFKNYKDWTNHIHSHEIIFCKECAEDFIQLGKRFIDSSEEINISISSGEALEEVKLMEEGKLKKRTAREMLKDIRKELEAEDN